MPCRDYGSDYVSPTDTWQFRELKDRADMLARIACKAMDELVKQGKADFLILRDEEVAEWYKKHQEEDRKAREKEERKQQRAKLRRQALRKLTEEEKIALGVKKGSKEDSADDLEDALGVAIKSFKA
jgi:hypothetical protein